MRSRICWAAAVVAVMAAAISRLEYAGGQQSSVTTDSRQDVAGQESTSHAIFDVDLTVQETPLGLPAVEPTDDDPRSVEQISLGRKLFFDPIMSVDYSTSCASCHRPENGFSHPDAKPTGAHGKIGRRNPPTLINRTFGKAQFWDGRIATLEEQVLKPIENPLEFANTVDNVMNRLRENEDYRKQFDAAFNDGITKENIVTAIAAFERTLLSGDSLIDRFITAEKASLNKNQRQGLWLYESKGGCWQCHSGKTFTDESFHNTGVSWGALPLDLGRFEVTEQEEHRGQFKTPTLRDVALTAPYMHDGSIETLREVVEFYNKGGVKNPYLDRRMKPLNLTEQEMDDLVEFLKALTGRHAWDLSAEEPR